MQPKGYFIQISCFIFFFQIILVSSQTPGFSALDPDVFKSLKSTGLKNLTGRYVNSSVTMQYKLQNNLIDEVHAEKGKFEVETGKLLAQIPKTKGSISGEFDTKITVDVLKKYVTPVLLVSGSYKAMIDDVDLTIGIQLPKSPDDKMSLADCTASVSKLDLTLSPYHKSDELLVKNLKEWLTAAMRPSFSELFCDIMTKILDDGIKPMVSRALTLRSCSISGGQDCANEGS